MTSNSTRAKPINFGWRRWAAACLMDGTPVDDLVGVMKENGFDEGKSRALCEKLLDDPTLAAGRWAAQRLHKLESVLTMRQQMRDLSPVGGEVERRAGVSSQEFLDEYYSANLPVVLTDVCDRWPARKRWTPEYLLGVLGDEKIEVMADRESDPQYEINSNSHKKTMRFSKYIRHMLDAETSNDLYVVANNHLLESQAAAPLWKDFRLERRYLKPFKDRQQAFLWYGPAGTVTPLHHDTLNVLFTQIVGEKQITLISPLETHCVYNDMAVYSKVDPLSPDLDRYPMFASVRRFDVPVGSGDALFIPAGWWHHVRSLSRSASVSFTNFRWNNAITWQNPDISY
jgi:ribosomal protein L16 Arg81 hydroxylase